MNSIFYNKPRMNYTYLSRRLDLTDSTSVNGNKPPDKPSVCGARTIEKPIHASNSLM